MTRVLVWPRGDGAITRCESDYFEDIDITGGIEIAQGDTERHIRAQADWFADPPFLDADGIPNYKLVDGEAQLRTEAEKDADREAMQPGPSGDLEPRVDALENKVDEIIPAQLDGLRSLGVDV